MKQFYELYKYNDKVSPLVTQFSWKNHLKIMSACKTMEERIFYMNMCIKEPLSKRELERQIESGYYERYMLSQKPLTPVIEESRRATENVFLDNYILDFLDVPDTVSERYRFAFYHRGLSCLVAFELKIGEFKPQFIPDYGF